MPNTNQNQIGLDSFMFLPNKILILKVIQHKFQTILNCFLIKKKRVLYIHDMLSLRKF